MAQRDNSKFSNRLEDAAKAKADMLAKARARAEEAKINFAAKSGERAALAVARDDRLKKRAEEKRLAAIQAEKDRAAAEAARLQAEAEAKAQAEREHEEKLKREEELEIEQKAKRDARYAARKAVKKKGR